MSVEHVLWRVCRTLWLLALTFTGVLAVDITGGLVYEVLLGLVP